MLGPSGHHDTFTRDNLPPQADWPEICGLPDYPAWLNAGAALCDPAHGTRVALIDGDGGQVSYDALACWTNRLARALVDGCGLVPGNRVLIRGGNTPATVAVWLAVLKAGGVAVITMPMQRAGELRAIVEKAQVSLALCETGLEGALDDCTAGSGPRVRVLTYGAPDAALDQLASPQDDRFEPVATGRDDVALLAFTSGTTGTPKATMHFHRDLLVIADLYGREVLDIAPEDVCIGTPPLAFTFGLGGLAIFPLRRGAAAVLPGALTPPALGEVIAHHGATICFTSPTAYRAMLDLPQAKTTLSSLRLAVSAGETLPGPVFEAWSATTGIPILDGIGATELLHIFISNSAGSARAGMTGLPVTGYQARVVDDEMRDQPAGTPGRLAVRGPTGCRYLADPRQADYVRDGWNLTGDSFVQETDGTFRFVARADDMILSAGYSIAGPEVEAALLSHPSVAECAVVAAPDATRGHVVEAHVVLAEGVEGDDATKQALQDHVKAQIAPYKYPRSVRFCAALPKTATGKIQRFALRAAALSPDEP